MDTALRCAFADPDERYVARTNESAIELLLLIIMDRAPPPLFVK